MSIDKSWSPRRHLENSYRSNLQNLGDKLWEAVAEIEDPTKIINYLTFIVNAPQFQQSIYTAVSKMVTGLFVDNAKTWRQAARESMKGRMIYQALQKEMQGPVGQSVRLEIARNAELIKTLPADIAHQVVRYVEAETLKGRRSEDIAAEILKMFPEKTNAKADLIARTEVSKTNTALIQARSARLNLPAYVWTSEKDSRVRTSHQKMDGVIVFWSESPAPEQLARIKSNLGHYHAGCCPNCRCFPEVLIDLSDVSWPHKVYTGGQIVMMTTSQFKQRFNIAA